MRVIKKEDWEEWKKKNAERQETGVVRPWDFFNPNTEFADDELQNSRYSTCVTCEHFTIAKTCKKCGCFMPNKTKLLHAKCPIENW